ncbi:putative sulfate exporter family transporter [Weissella coleopterorum]|uniref:Putative sulfate exporter family transporter n=1 Tax=Weissella coleopterorum TaxID=2714949 RepID=A0A6G8B0Q5_9LACO|nr:putative sulfate exporter family transporter [Weissella coleopterorum]QIL50795.1 putative sulfate exporter family transporter [Weissella coleopterorum]
MKIKQNMWLGIIVTVLVSIISEFLSKFMPSLGAEAIALILGIILGNTLLRQPQLVAGVRWSEKYPIEIGIALLGIEVTLQTIRSLGWQGIIYIIILMTATILFVMWIGKLIFKVDQKSGMLMGAGNAVCGSSAIAAVAPEINATDTQRRTAVATVSLSGVVLLFILPIIGPAVFHGNDLLIGALIGGTVQSVGQVIGTASLVNPQVIDYATLYKMLRVVMLAVVVLIMSTIVKRRDFKMRSNEMAQGKKHIKVYKLVPWFIYTFIILLFVSSIVSIPHSVVQGAKTITGFFGVVNLAGIGLNLKWQTIANSGLKYLGYGFMTIVFQVGMALLLINMIY